MCRYLDRNKSRVGRAMNSHSILEKLEVTTWFFGFKTVDFSYMKTPRQIVGSHKHLLNKCVLF